MKRPITITIAAVLVLVLLLLSAVWPLVGGDQLLGLGGASRGGMGGGMPSQGGTAPGNFQGGTPPSQNSQGQAPSTTGGFQTGSTGFSVNQSGLMKLTRILQYALYALEIIFGLIALGGLWTWKRWGIVMAIITSAIVLIATIPGMFRMFSAVSLIENILKVLLAIGVIVLVVLPKSKPAPVVAV